MPTWIRWHRRLSCRRYDEWLQQSWGLQILITAWLAHAFSTSNNNNVLEEEARWVASALVLQFVAGTTVYVVKALQPTALSDASPEGTAWGFAVMLMGIVVAYGWGLLETTANRGIIKKVVPPPLLWLAFTCHAVLGASSTILSLLFPRGFYEIPMFLFGMEAVIDPHHDGDGEEMVMIQSWGSFILGTSTVILFASQGKLPTMMFSLRNALTCLFVGLIVLYTSYYWVSNEIPLVFFWGTRWVVFVFMFLLYLLSLVRVQPKNQKTN
jgi:hypothetical protein